MRNLYTVTSEIISGEQGNIQYTAYYPIITSPENGAMRTINNFSGHACGEFIKYVRELSKCTEKTISVTRCYQLMYSSRFLISFKYETTLPDKDNGMYFHKSGVVWNTSCGSAVTVKEFFRGNVRYKEMILYILSGKIKEKVSKGERFCGDWHSRLYSSWQNMGYYICPEGFVFLLPKNTLRDEENSTAEILIPFAELKNQLGGRLLT